MTRSIFARTALVCSLIAIALFTGLRPSTATPAFGATMTTINFDDLAPTTAVSNQYDAQGVDFGSGIIDNNVYCFPVIKQVSNQNARSGDQVADISCANGEFPDSSIRGVLKNTAQHLSLYAGYFPTFSNPPATAGVALTAYDLAGNVVGTDTESVPTAQGTQTLLQVASTSANIDHFDVTGQPPNIVIDDLSFDNPSGVPPSFNIQPASSFVQVRQGFSTKDPVAIQRHDGSTGGVAFSSAGLPHGVHVSFNPNPAKGTSTTMTVSADPTAPLPASGPFPTFSIKGKPTSASVGAASSKKKITLVVQSDFTVETATSEPLPPCTTDKLPVFVSYAQGFTGDVTLSASGVPADDQASFDPTTVKFPTDGTFVARSTLTITSKTDVTGPAGTMTVIGKSGHFASRSADISVTRAAPTITSVSPSQGKTPQALQGGSEVIVTGKGLCPGLQQLAFGNQQAELTPVPVAPGGTQLQAIVPRQATTGPIYAFPAGGTINSPGTAVSPTYTVDNYRDTNGFSFTNSDQFQSNVGGYSFSDVSDVFGYDQTHLGFNPCWPFGDCTVATPVPDPLALLFWAIVNHFGGENGQCFGFSLGSQRLLHGDQSYSAFPSQNPAVTSVWNLQGPESAGGPSSAVSHFIHLTHMEQFSAESLHDWLTQATENAITGDQGSIISQVNAALAANDHPLIELRNGTDGHVVVAYDVEDGNNGDKLIDVYDPNQNYTTSEENPGGFTHQAILTNSQITVHPNGHWEFPGFSPAWHAGPGSLVVVPYGTVPVQPTMPTTRAGLFDFFFGSAHPSQVTDAAGHTLLAPNGDINTDSKTGIPSATRFAALAGSNKPGSDIFLFGKTGMYKQTIVGTGAGQYTNALMGSGMAVSIKAGSAKGTVDDVTVDPRSASVGFGAAAGKASGANAGITRPVTTELFVQAADGTEADGHRRHLPRRGTCRHDVIHRCRRGSGAEAYRSCRNLLPRTLVGRSARGPAILHHPTADGCVRRHGVLLAPRLVAARLGCPQGLHQARERPHHHNYSTQHRQTRCHVRYFAERRKEDPRQAVSDHSHEVHEAGQGVECGPDVGDIPRREAGRAQHRNADRSEDSPRDRRLQEIVQDRDRQYLYLQGIGDGSQPQQSRFRRQSGSGKAESVQGLAARG